MKNFTKQNIKTCPLWIRLLIMIFMLLIGTGSAWAWGYKSAGGSWNDCTGSFSSITYYTTPTGSTTKSLDVIMKTKPGSGFNICQNTCSGQQLYVGLTGTASSSANTIVRGTAYWNDGLYSTYTVVIPEGKIYIKPTGGSAIEMTKSSYTYTASVQLSSAKTFDLYANDPGASISNENSMPSAGKPSSVRLNYTGLSSPYQYVKVSYDLKTNKITFTEEAAPCTPSATITEATYSCYGTTIHLEGSLTEACDGMYYGWQYKTTSGDDWSTATAIAGHATNNYSESATTYELDWTIPNPGTTYYFRAYATPDANTWYSDGTTEPVKTYKSPTLYTVSGSDATLTLSDSESGYTYTLYNNDKLVSNSEGTGNALSWTLNDGGTYTVKAKPSESNCDEVLMSGSYTYSPCALPVIKSTDADFNKNNFADFAALYVTDCSGKEITGYQWYKDEEAYVSTCNYTTKDGSEVGDAGQTNNIRPNEAGSYTCKVTYDDGTSATSAAFTVTATSGTTYADFNSPIPVIMVNTGSKNFPSCPVANETASKHADEMKKKLSVDVKILHNGSIVYDRKARMAYRGSSSLNFQKKSYAFCPGDANCGDDDKGPDYVQTAKLNMLGIGEATDKDWVLYAAAADPSMLRNRMVFDTYQAMTGNWGVHSRYVELIINGEYKGVYLMMDKVTQNKKRVNVKWEADGSSKGFIVKFDKTDIVDRSVDYPDGDEKTFLSKYSGKHNIGTYDTTNDQAFEIEYPEKEDIQEDGGDWYDVIDYIKGMFNSFEEALAAGDYTTVQQYIDYESWADWFILNEFTKNVDAYRASCVFTYDGTKIKANPLWDQELSFNNQSVHANRYTGDGGNKGCENVNYLLIQDDGVYSDNFAAPFWFTGTYVSGRGTYNGAATTFAGALLNDPCFVQTVKNRWEIHKQGALSKASLEALITAYETELTSAVRDREANFWSSNGYSRNTLSCSWGTNTTGYYDDTYADAKADITAWISDAAASGSTGRRAGLDAAIDKLEGTGLTISFEPMTVETTPWMPVTITVNNESGYQYTLTYTDGELDKQANVIIEKSGDTYKYHVPRPAAWNKGDEAVVDERTDIVYGLKATLQMGDDKVVCGSSNNGEAPSATATIILQDEPNENCPQ